MAKEAIKWYFNFSDIEAEAVIEDADLEMITDIENKYIHYIHDRLCRV